MTTSISAEEFDRKFDDGEDITPYLDLTSARRVNASGSRKININMPIWLIDRLDAEAQHLTVNRQAVINMWLAERVAEEDERRAVV
jgi:hypothetical protein